MYVSAHPIFVLVLLSLNRLKTVAKLPAWVPGNSFRREADKWAISVSHGIEKPYRFMRDAAVS